MEEIRIVLFGIGGYGDIYVRALLEERARERYSIVGVVDPYAKNARGYAELAAREVPFFDTPDAFFAKKSADLAVISTPIPFHEAHAICAMEHGCDVLLEKPIAATPEAGRRIARTAEQLGRRLAIGFQWCYDEAMLRLKADFDAGLLGAPKRLRAIVLWPRDFAYYRRGTGWAGKKLDRDGNPIFDSIASNATAHYLENMLWLTGKGYEGASITDLRCETWRANDIETYDTLTLLAKLDNGTELNFVTSHAVLPEEIRDPLFEYEFENATVRFDGVGEEGRIVAEFADGTVREYGASYRSNHEKIWTMLDVMRGKAEIPCPPQAALRHADAIAAIREREPDSRVFRNVCTDGTRAWAPGLAAALRRCYDERILLSETGMW